MERVLREKLIGGKFNNVLPSVSKMMAAIKGTKSKTTEIKFHNALINAGITNFCINATNMPGSPDIYFPSYGIVVFLDGCFWHGCPLCGNLPKTNTAYWQMKIERNKQRDLQKRQLLRNDGYIVLQYWEHELKDDLAKCVSLLNDSLEIGLLRAVSSEIF